MVQELIWSPASGLDTLTEQPPESCMYRSILARCLGLSVVCGRALWQVAFPQHQCSITSGCILHPEWGAGLALQSPAVLAAGWRTAVPLYCQMPETQRRRFVIWVLHRLLPDHQQGLWRNKGWDSDLSSLKSLCLSPQNLTFQVEVLSKSNSRKSKSM